MKGKSIVKAEYKNWIPLTMIEGFTAGAAVLAASAAAVFDDGDEYRSPAKNAAFAALCTGSALCGCAAAWLGYCRSRYSYDGERKLSKQMIEGTAAYITLPDGGKGLDVGCGSGALAIACARRNPRGKMIGIDLWGKDFRGYSKLLCERNAAAEEVYNVSFEKGNAVRLDYPDETFDAVTSNYVYHNIPGVNKQKLLRETLRVLKKGGVFAVHDIMSPECFGDMNSFVRELLDAGYERAELIPTDRGLFMSPSEAAVMGLKGSVLLVGRK